MKIALIGATGFVGSTVLAEALERGHKVTAIARHPESLAAQAGMTARQGDVNDAEKLSSLLAGHDAVLSALKFEPTDISALIGAVKNSGVKRFLMVGGAGSLEVAPGVALVDTPDFPDAYKPEALAGREALKRLQAESDLEWSFLSPSAELLPGEATGTFRLGKDHLLTGEDGHSRISVGDYAIALLDELERPTHIRQRFTVGY